MSILLYLVAVIAGGALVLGGLFARIDVTCRLPSGGRPIRLAVDGEDVIAFGVALCAATSLALAATVALS